MVKYSKNGKEFNLNITADLLQTLRENPPKDFQKAIMQKKRSPNNSFVDLQDTDDDGNLKFSNSTISTHSIVYFDLNGNFYFRAFPSANIEFGGKKIEVLVTNPKIKIAEDANWYGKGVHSHVQPIPGSELWDDGNDSMAPHGEAIAKGSPETLIVCTLTRDEVLKIDLKPTATDPLSEFLKLSPAEQLAFAERIKKLTTEE